MIIFLASVTKERVICMKACIYIKACGVVDEKWRADTSCLIWSKFDCQIVEYSVTMYEGSMKFRSVLYMQPNSFYLFHRVWMSSLCRHSNWLFSFQISETNNSIILLVGFYLWEFSRWVYLVL